MKEVFLDSSFAIALASTSDQHHQRSLQITDRIQQEGWELVTTRAICLEIGNALAKQRFRDAAVRLLGSLESDPTVTIEPLTEDLYLRACDLFRSRTDKSWGLIDCVSFIVMNDRELTEALTSDNHFQQAGFAALLVDAN